MNTKIISILSFLLFIFLFNPLRGQQNTPPFFAHFEGIGFVGTGSTKNMKLSMVTIGSTHPENFKVENNKAFVGKNGVYKISVSSGVTGNDIASQGLGYAVYVNNILVASATSSTIPTTGIYEIQKSLNQGDVIVVSVTKNFDFPSDAGENKVYLTKI
ncbi:hypothetical protein [Chryseobacterium caseinilyticum]|uniref:Uncharacterized protein n=1 Tax=Chryseobacterium caseinilyticum TaxID=2771428 RepID=A0ABR8ZG61_9FLAO|nr:hypothetical protein [Chryseobacterium caseinilyticum]MBD8084290.1 hypothetical protein [Chryseobacterium caseinilyticum]